jgi:hypothetical protein
VTVCRECGEPFAGLPHWHTCSGCWSPPRERSRPAAPVYRPGPAVGAVPSAVARLEQRPGQLALWDEATSANVVGLRRRRAA